MSPVDAFLWLIVALFAVALLFLVFLIGWFVVETVRGKP